MELILVDDDTFEKEANASEQRFYEAVVRMLLGTVFPHWEPARIEDLVKRYSSSYQKVWEFVQIIGTTFPQIDPLTLESHCKQLLREARGASRATQEESYADAA